MDKGGGNSTPNFGDLLSKSNKAFPKQYHAGVNAYFGDLERFLSGEQQARDLYDPFRIAEQQGLQGIFGPTMYGQQLEALRQLDPTGYNLREQTGKSLADELSAGHGLSADQSNAIEQEIRRSQASRGNIYGQAPVEAEAFAKGQYGDQLWQQRLSNAMNFQNSATPESWIQSIAPVSADRSMAYVNPNAGFLGVNASNAAFQNALGTAGLNAQGQQSNPWGSVLGSLASLAPVLISAFSDRRLKSNIEKIGNLNGFDVFKYKIFGRNEIGVMAQDVEKVRPDAIVHDESGFLRVNYAKLGLPFLPSPA